MSLLFVLPSFSLCHKLVVCDCGIPGHTYIFFKIEAMTSKIVSEYDQEIPQSQTADNPVAPGGRAAQPSQDTKKTN